MNNNKIVIAEDNSTLSLLFKFRLEKEGYELLMAVDSKELEVSRRQSTTFKDWLSL